MPPADGGDGGDVRLSDLGATCAYDRAAGDQLERVEVRSLALRTQPLTLSLSLSLSLTLTRSAHSAG